MSEIPEAIRDTAYQIAYRWAMPNQEALCGATEAIAEALVAAIRAQIERDAGICDRYAKVNRNQRGFHEGAVNLAKRIRNQRRRS